MAFYSVFGLKVRMGYLIFDVMYCSVFGIKAYVICKVFGLHMVFDLKLLVTC